MSNKRSNPKPVKSNGLVLHRGALAGGVAFPLLQAFGSSQSFENAGICRQPSIGPAGYGLRVTGDSGPFPSGSILLVEPDQVPGPGSYGVVQFSNGRAYFMLVDYGNGGTVLLQSPAADVFGELRVRRSDLRAVHRVVAVLLPSGGREIEREEGSQLPIPCEQIEGRDAVFSIVGGSGLARAGARTEVRQTGARPSRAPSPRL